MPFDQKKINGPENSFSYKQFIKKPEKPLNINDKRSDERDLLEPRKIGI